MNVHRCTNAIPNRRKNALKRSESPIPNSKMISRRCFGILSRAKIKIKTNRLSSDKEYSVIQLAKNDCCATESVHRTIKIPKPIARLMYIKVITDALRKVGSFLRWVHAWSKSKDKRTTKNSVVRR